MAQHSTWNPDLNNLLGWPAFHTPVYWMIGMLWN